MKGQLRLARRAIVCLFFSVGASYGILTSRIPALCAQINGSESIVGAAMLCLGIGSLAGFASISILLKFWRQKNILRVTTFLLYLFLPLTGLSWNGLSFCASFLLFGTVFALSDVALNMQGLLLEHRLRHHCLAGLHASYSMGGVSGAALGAMTAALELTPLLSFCCFGAVFVMGWTMVSGNLLAETSGQRGTINEKDASEGRIPAMVVLFGILALMAFTVEGACGEWSALLLHTEKGASESLAALGFGAFSISMCVGRLFGDRLRRSRGDFRLLLTSTLAALIGQVIVIFAPWPLLCLCGYSLAGLGMAPIAPLILSRGGNRTDISPQRAATIISIMGYAGLLVVPPSIGWLAESFGLSMALLLPLSFTLILMLSSFLFRKREGDAPSIRKRCGIPGYGSDR